MSFPSRYPICLDAIGGHKISRGLYVGLFVFTAFTFVPVVFFFFFGALVAPCIYLVFDAAFGPGGELIKFLEVGQIAFFIGVFYLCARLAYRVSKFFNKGTAQNIVQGLTLLVLFSCSFLSVINESDVCHQSGTYNFWSACVRYLESDRNKQNN